MQTRSEAVTQRARDLVNKLLMEAPTGDETPNTAPPPVPGLRTGVGGNGDEQEIVVHADVTISLTQKELEIVRVALDRLVDAYDTSPQDTVDATEDELHAVYEKFTKAT